MYYAAQLLVIDCSFNLFIILHTVLCKTIARELCEFHFFVYTNFPGKSQESSSDNLWPFEQNFLGTKNTISSNFHSQPMHL